MLTFAYKVHDERTNFSLFFSCEIFICYCRLACNHYGCQHCIAIVNIYWLGNKRVGKAKYNIFWCSLRTCKAVNVYTPVRISFSLRFRILRTRICIYSYVHNNNRAHVGMKKTNKFSWISAIHLKSIRFRILQ